LWPETVAALNAVIAKRPAPRDEAHAEFVFITCRGVPWSNGPLGGRDSIGLMFRRVLINLGLYRSGIGFYSLRRSFATVASNSLDQIAVDAIMGHSPRHSDMPALYRQRVSDSRLEAVANYVRQWLFSKTPTAE
jgi:integrase